MCKTNAWRASTKLNGKGSIEKPQIRQCGVVAEIVLMRFLRGFILRMLTLLVSGPRCSPGRFELQIPKQVALALRFLLRFLQRREAGLKLS